MSSTIKLSVEVYQSDFGIVSIINMNPVTNPETVTGASANHDRGYLINPDYYGIHELIPMGLLAYLTWVVESVVSLTVH